MKLSGKLIILAAAVIGVDAAALKAWWGEHPVIAASVSVAWAAAVGASSLLLKAVKKPADQRLEQFGAAADRALAHRLSRYGKRYAEHVAYKARFMNLATRGLAIPTLDEVFVDVGLDYQLPDQAVKSVVPADSGGDPVRRFSVWQLLDRPEPVIVVLLGAPGSGKTTLLRHVAGELARRPKAHRRPLPVLVELRDHVAAIVSDPTTPLANVTRASVASAGLSELDGWWETRLRGGECVVLLDGLDELADAEQRGALSWWISQQIEANHRCDFVITSRPLGYTSTVPIPGALVLETKPFTEEQVRKFLRAWYRAEERVSMRQEGPEVDRLADEKAAGLLQQLADNPNLDDLKANPLLLTMIAYVHRYRGELPGGRAELYKEVCEVMLWRRAEAKNLAPILSGAVKMSLLADLGRMMMVEERRDIPYEQARHHVRRLLTRVESSVTPEEFLADVVTSGLLVEREHRILAFAHQTIQEYLASTLVDSEMLALRVNDPWWHETTQLFVSSGGDANPIVAACLVERTIESLTLAFECTEGGVPLAPDLGAALSAALSDAFEDAASREYKLVVAGVLARRHFRSPKRASTGARIYAPVPANLYRLFLSTTEYRPPDGDFEVGPGAISPVTGIRGEDARAFLPWLNGLVPFSLQLPTALELDETMPGIPAHCSTSASGPRKVTDKISIATLVTDVTRLGLLERLGALHLRESLDTLVDYLARAHSLRHQRAEILVDVDEYPASWPSTDTDMIPSLDQVPYLDHAIGTIRKDLMEIVRENLTTQSVLTLAARAVKALQQFDHELLDLSGRSSGTLRGYSTHLAPLLERQRTRLAEMIASKGPEDVPANLLAQVAATPVIEFAVTAVLRHVTSEVSLPMADLIQTWLDQLSRSEHQPTSIAHDNGWRVFEAALDDEFDTMMRLRTLPTTDEASRFRISALAVATCAHTANDHETASVFLAKIVTTIKLEERRDHPELLERLILARHD